MKRTISTIVLTLFSALCFAGGAKDTNNQPDWFKNYKIVFQTSEYLAQRGSGVSAESAKTDAVAQLARYFQTTVNANLSTTMNSISSGDFVDENLTVVDEVKVTSEVDFIGLEFTESYYYKAEKKWYAVAYVNRRDAWIQYQPKIDSAKNKFYGFYKKAENETDAFKKLSLYKSAWEASFDFMEKLEFGRIISSMEEKKYSADRDAVAEIPSKIERTKNNLTSTFSIKGDWGEIIGTSVKRAFEKEGFKFGISGNYKLSVTVDSNAFGIDPVAIMPSVKIVLSSKSGEILFSFEEKLDEKTVSYTLENAQKKAFPKLAELIEREIKF